MDLKPRQMPEIIEAVAFDMDGLIFDTESLSRKAFFITANQFNIDVEDDYYKKFIGHSQPVCDRLMYDRYGENFDTTGFRTIWWRCVSELFEIDGVDFKSGFHDLFSLFKREKLPLALVTTSSYGTVLRNFKDWDYPDLFDTVITWDRGLPAKPAPDKYLAAASDLKVMPENMMVLEDSNIGMQAAINAGCKAAMIPDLVEPSDYIEKTAFKIFSSLNNVNEWFTRQIG